MDIIHLRYFINIVECNYNLSLAAKKIHISQPALSQFIKNFERQYNVLLFKRRNGRLVELTAAGQEIYKYALQIVDLYEDMEESIRIESLRQSGSIRIAIPSIILSVYLTDYLPKLAEKHPDTHIEIIDANSNEIRKLLINNTIDIGIMMEPTNLDKSNIEQHNIEKNEMVAFIDNNHPLAQKDNLDWENLEGHPIATFNKDYITYELIYDKLSQINLEDQIKYTSSAWDFLIESTKGSDIVTILPKPVKKYINEKDKYTMKLFNDYIPFNFRACRPVKDDYTDFEDFVYKDIIDGFKNRAAN